MGSFTVGDVVLVRFPFSDLSGSKLRPAVILADSDRGDWILCQITSKAYADPKAIRHTSESYASGTLDRDSFIRPGKIFTANNSIIAQRIATLDVKQVEEPIDGVVALLTRISHKK